MSVCELSSSTTDAAAASAVGRKRRLGETRDVLTHMRLREATTYRRPLPSDDSSCSDRDSDGTSVTATTLPAPFHGLWRQQIIEWMYTLVGYCKLRHEAAAAATYYLDQAACRGLIVTPGDYQLGAMTSLYLALKVYDSPSMRIVKLSSLVKLGNGEFYEEDIVRMEKDLVKLLEWRLNPVTANCFLQQYLVILEEACSSCVGVTVDTVRVEELALQAIEAIVARESFLAVPPSVAAYAALSLALEQQTELRPPLRQRQKYAMLRQTFYHHMVEVGDLDANSHAVVKASLMLERATTKQMQLAVPPPSPTSTRDEVKSFGRGQRDRGVSMTNSSRNNSSSTMSSTDNDSTDTRMDGMGKDPDVSQFLEAACGNGYSPNFVAMQ